MFIAAFLWGQKEKIKTRNKVINCHMDNDLPNANTSILLNIKQILKITTN